MHTRTSDDIIHTDGNNIICCHRRTQRNNIVRILYQKKRRKTVYVYGLANRLGYTRVRVCCYGCRSVIVFGPTKMCIFLSVSIRCRRRSTLNLAIAKHFYAFESFNIITVVVARR